MRNTKVGPAPYTLANARFPWSDMPPDIFLWALVVFADELQRLHLKSLSHKLLPKNAGRVFLRVNVS